jgi:hypothetical protein
VEFQRERLQIRIEIGAQFEQCLQADFYKEIVCDPIHHPPKKLDHDEAKTEQRDPEAPITAHCRPRTKEIVHDQLKRPRFEQIQANANKRDEQPEDRLTQKRSVVTENAPVDRHVIFRLQISVFRLN